VFYTPVGADRVKVVFYNGSSKNRVVIDNVLLAPVRVEGFVNINPEFSLGRFNYSGYVHAHTSPIILKDDGSGDGYLDTAHGWVMGDPIPVQPRRKYVITYRARRPAGAKHHAASLTIRFCKGQKKVETVRRMKGLLVKSEK